MTEQRLAPRVATGTAAAFSSAKNSCRATLMNISATGAFIGTDTVLPVDTELALHLKLPEDLEVMALKGRVVWAKHASNAFPSGMGIEFMSMPPACRRKIEQFVDTRLRRQHGPHDKQCSAEAAC